VDLPRSSSLTDLTLSNGALKLAASVYGHPDAPSLLFLHGLGLSPRQLGRRCTAPHGPLYLRSDGPSASVGEFQFPCAVQSKWLQAAV
jgi:pimeloyl-ACP methyl ester carboxylesterase